MELLKQILAFEFSGVEPKLKVVRVAIDRPVPPLIDISCWLAERFDAFFVKQILDYFSCACKICSESFYGVGLDTEGNVSFDFHLVTDELPNHFWC